MTHVTSVLNCWDQNSSDGSGCGAIKQFLIFENMAGKDGKTKHFCSQSTTTHAEHSKERIRNRTWTWKLLTDKDGRMQINATTSKLEQNQFCVKTTVRSAVENQGEKKKTKGWVKIPNSYDFLHKRTQKEKFWRMTWSLFPQLLSKMVIKKVVYITLNCFSVAWQQLSCF